MMKKFLVLIFAMLLLVGCSSKDEVVPDNMQIASIENAAYRLYVPKSWNVNTESGVSSAFTTVQSANVSVMSYMPDTEAMSIDDYWQKTEESYRANFAGYTFISKETGTLGGRPSGVYTFDLTIDGQTARMMQVIAAYGDMFYVLTYTAPADSFEANLEEVQTIVDCFVFR